MVDDTIARRADDLARYVAEMSRRVASAGGVRDLGELVGLAERVRAALALVESQEIGWAVEQVAALERELRALGDSLSTVQRLQAAFHVRPPGAAPDASD